MQPTYLCTIIPHDGLLHVRFVPLLNGWFRPLCSYWTALLTLGLPLLQSVSRPVRRGDNALQPLRLEFFLPRIPTDWFQALPFLKDLQDTYSRTGTPSPSCPEPISHSHGRGAPNAYHT
jgi:hypothetical protein